MTFEDAVNSADEEDLLINEVWFQRFPKKVWKETILQGACAVSDQWQVIKAEPKVLTADDYDKRIKETSPRNGECQRCWIQGNRHGFQNGDKNGQLKEWNRTKELREAAMDAVELISTSLPTGKALEKAIKNLKPLCQ